MSSSERKEKNYPEVEFTFIDDGKTPEEIREKVAELIRKRDELLKARGYLPPDQEHAFWWKPKSEKK